MPYTLESPSHKHPLVKVQHLVDELNNSGIRYCHWKSNIFLAESLAGQTDIDLLIDRRDAGRFRAILSQLCFRPAVTPDSESFPSVEHHYSLDEESGVLVHVHAYFQVITGESLSKNYHFPVEQMLLQNTSQMNSVRVPTRSAELLIFTMRIMLKHTSLVELLMLSRYRKEVKREIEWLLETGSIEEAAQLAKEWLPVIDCDLISECVLALEAPAPLSRRIMLGYRLRRQLRPYARHSITRNWLAGIRKFTTLSVRRLRGARRGATLRNGGAIVAFVGSEATGKSTLLAETRGWLGEHIDVVQIHVGKPKSTPLSFVPNLFVPALRILLPGNRTTNVEAQYNQLDQANKPPAAFPIMFGFRSVLLAYERLAMLTRAFRQAANGTVVLCDRYPSSLEGAPDSQQLPQLAGTLDGDRLRKRLAQSEARLYRKMPSPDLVVYLKAPLEVTLLRNAERGKTEPENYVRRRHARSSSLEFGKTPVCEINTDQPFEQTILEVKRAVWNVL